MVNLCVNVCVNVMCDKTNGLPVARVSIRDTFYNTSTLESILLFCARLKKQYVIFEGGEQHIIVEKVLSKNYDPCREIGFSQLGQ